MIPSICEDAHVVAGFSPRCHSVALWKRGLKPATTCLVAVIVLLFCSTAAFAQLTITTNSLPDGKVGLSYTAPALSATGGTPPYTWSIIAGALPSGLTLATNGVISGTPTVSGIFNFTVRVTDSTAASNDKPLNIKVPLEVTTNFLPNGLVNTAYSQTLNTTPTIGNPVTWSLTGGSLPTGLSPSISSGTISGTPTAAGTFNFTVTATDSETPTPLTASKDLSITIQPPLVITSTSPLPLAIVGVFYAYTFQSTGPTPTWSIVSGVTPPGLNLSPSGSLTGTPTIANTFNFTVQATASNPTQTVTMAFQLTVNPALTITTASPLPTAIVGSGYSATLTANGGLPPYSWTVQGTGLPPGLTLSTGGVLSGTPTTAGNYSFTAQVSDSYTPTQQATRSFSLTVSSTLTITTNSLPNGTISVAYGPVTLAAGPGTLPFTWSVSSGTLPNGLTLSTDGIISGTPTTAGTFNFTLMVKDSGTPQQTATKALSIIIQPTLTITTTSPLPLGVVGAFYSQTFTATGPSPLTWSVISGLAPPGLTLTNSGTLAGTPSVPGTYNFTVQASGGNPLQTATQALQMVVNPALSITTPATLPAASPLVSYTVTLAATGGVPPYTWTMTGGNLPPGLAFSSAGIISGIPTTAGTFTFTAQVSDSFIPTQTTNRTFAIVVATTLTVSTASLPNGAVGKTYSQALAAAAGTPPYTWSLQFGGALPLGLNLSTDGIISGTPTSAGTSSFTVMVTDSASTAQSATKALTLTIQPLLTINTSGTLPLAVVGAFYSLLMDATGPSPLTWTVVSGIAPPGLTLTTSGALAGTPLAAGTYDFTVQATGGDPVQTATQALRVVVNDALQFVTPANLPDAPLGVPYAVTLEAKGGLPPYTWTNPGGGLPAGLTLSSSGVLSGTPTGIGNFSFTLQAADAFSPTQRVSRTFTLAVTTTLSITTTTLPSAILNAAYNQQLQAAGTGPFTWLVTAGNLPAGITLTPAGVLQGTPTEVGSQTFTVRVTDARGANVGRDFTLVVDPPLPALSAPGLPATLPTRQVADIAVALAAPHPSTLTGQLKLTFTSNAEIPSDDPAVQFSTGGRTVNFTIPANTRNAVFASRTMLLTGTVAGTVRLTATIDNGPTDVPVATVDIPATAPQMTDVTAVKTAAGLDVQITGFAPARRVSTVEFSFDIKVGTQTKHQTLTKNVETDFSNWYRNSASTTFGSAFSYLQSFTISGGDASTIEGVTVKLTNAQGSTTSATVKPK